MSNLVESGPFAVGSIAAEASDTSVDQFRVVLLQFFVAQAHFVGAARFEVLDKYVDFTCQFAHHFEPLGVAEIDRQITLVAVDR